MTTNIRSHKHWNNKRGHVIRAETMDNTDLDSKIFND